jgi:hypothetical protein
MKIRKIQVSNQSILGGGGGGGEGAGKGGEINVVTHFVSIASIRHLRNTQFVPWYKHIVM